MANINNINYNNPNSSDRLALTKSLLKDNLMAHKHTSI
jgi:hypothetical protein